jgi:hypothetical protein
VSVAQPGPVSTNDDLATPVVYRNGRWFRGFSWTVIVGAALMSALMVMMAFSSVFPLSGFSFGRAISIFFYLVGAASFASMCTALAKYVQRLCFYHVQLDMEGVEFLFGTKKKPELVRMQWAQISAVRYKRVANEHLFTVVGNDGSSASFSSNTFFGAKKIARRIAAHANQLVQEC